MPNITLKSHNSKPFQPVLCSSPNDLSKIELPMSIPGTASFNGALDFKIHSFSLATQRLCMPKYCFFFLTFQLLYLTTFLLSPYTPVTCEMFSPFTHSTNSLYPVYQHYYGHAYLAGSKGPRFGERGISFCCMAQKHHNNLEVSIMPVLGKPD